MIVIKYKYGTIKGYDAEYFSLSSHKLSILKSSGYVVDLDLLREGIKEVLADGTTIYQSEVA